MSKILIFSGAGLSAESGLKTFRDNGGLWDEYDVKEVCSTFGFKKDRQKVMNFYDKRRCELKQVAPNDAHFMIARVKQKFGDKISVITQNVDDLLERAGCSNVIHVHGTLKDLRCERCDFVFDIGYSPFLGHKCPNCKSDFVRHNVVMFGEMAPFYANLYQELSLSELFICIGSSGEVLDVASFAKMCKFSILNNLQSSRLDRFFTKIYIEKATIAAKKIENDIENFINFGKI